VEGPERSEDLQRIAGTEVDVLYTADSPLFFLFCFGCSGGFVMPIFAGDLYEV